jgi:hypothetical protein
MSEIVLILNHTRVQNMYIVAAIVDDGKNTISIGSGDIGQEIIGGSSDFENCATAFLAEAKRNGFITTTEVEFITYTKQNFRALVTLMKNHRYPDDAFTSFIKQNRKRYSS